MYLGGTRIFVSIASYRDPEAPHTVRSLLEKADRPQNITIGVLSQLEQDHDSHCVVGSTPQVREVIVPARESRGACWARHRIFTTLMHDEDFVLQIDSHSRFDPGWDTCLLQMYESTNDPNAVLSTYPSAFDPHTGFFSPQMYNRFDCQNFNGEGLPIVSSAAFSLDKAPATLALTPFIAGGCMFTTTRAVRTVPYDPFLYFVGEELNYAIRLWTHGFNIYTPNRGFMYHFYGKSPVAPKHWDDQVSRYGELNSRSFERNKHLLGIKPSKNTKALQFLELFDFGKARTYAQWQACAGIDIQRQVISDDARVGIMKAFDSRPYSVSF